ncbi:acetyl-coenzyme A synthetase 2-like, mitochondrial isoform X4 [Poecilia reticulata]|uniref:acetyl-coenzyme A synthetase 2-like, mitochondrial isoform X4 n=1 Tax=Poecilia reticulata TaxID=8081 RepID=UPI0007EA28E8|nr:PREDICTED: acetyl-coenzyme A synthetase 2-like, mitochondrial isoform X4 [Poecilia reticulata]
MTLHKPAAETRCPHPSSSSELFSSPEKISTSPGNVSDQSRRELLETTCRLANALKAHRIQKGDRVAVYMLVSPLAVAAMLACARIGAVHTVAFAGFSSQALAGRIQDVGVRLPRWRRVWLHGGHRLNHRTQPPLSCWTAHLCTWIQVSRVSSTKTPCFTYTASSGGKIPHSPLEAF